MVQPKKYNIHRTCILFFSDHVNSSPRNTTECDSHSSPIHSHEGSHFPHYIVQNCVHVILTFSRFELRECTQIYQGILTP